MGSRQSIRSLLLSLTSLFVSLGSLTLFSYLVPLNADSMRAIGARPFEGVDIVHFASNAFFRWRVDPFLLAGALAVETITRVTLGNALAVFSLAIFSAGLARHHIEQNPETSFATALARAVLPSLVILALLGADTAIATSIAYLPLLVVAIARASSRITLVSISALIILTIASSWSANQLAPVLMALAIIFGTGRHFRPSMLLLMCPAILAGTFVETPHFPDYPQEAHLVPLSPPLSRALPLIGKDSFLPVLDRIHYKAQLFPLSLALLACAVAAVRLRRVSSCRMNYAALFFASAVAFETFGKSTRFLRYGPLNEMARLIPNLSLLDPWGPAIALTVVSLAFSPFLRGLVVLVFSITGVLLAIVIGRPLSQSLGDQLPYAEWRALSPDRASIIAPLLFSPSYFVAKEWGLRIFDEWGDGRPLGLTPEVATIRASHNPNLIQHLIDGNPATRWSPERGGQYGDESIRICLTHPLRATSIELVAGGFVTDFPRGLRICSFASEARAENFQQGSSCRDGGLIFETRDWQGAVALTAAGYPYFQGQHVVVIPTFEHAQKGCFQIEQTSIAKGFDWSVAEIRLGVSEEPEQL